MLDCELIRVEGEFGAFNISLLINVSKLLVLFLDPSEFDPSLLCPIKENVFGIWECHHQVLEVFLFKAVSVCSTVNT